MRLNYLLILSLAALLSAGTAVAEDDTLQQANQFIQSGNYDGAIELLETYLAENPESPETTSALLAIAGAHHIKGDYMAAVEANRKAAETPWATGTAQYNAACALSLLEKPDEAYQALQLAVAAGFLDYDLMEADSDLANMKAKHDIEFPSQQQYEDFKGHNGVELGYKVITPRGYDPSKSYPALLLFPAGSGKRSADWAIDQLVGAEDLEDWIVVYPIAPDRGWFTHPSHHALNDMLDKIRGDYKIESDMYHLAGFASGARAASTYSGMSREYFLSLTTFSAWHWNRWDDEDLSRGFGMPVRLVVGEADTFGRDMNEHVKELMGDASDTEVQVIAVNDHRLASIRDGRLIEYIPYERPGMTQP